MKAAHLDDLTAMDRNAHLARGRSRKISAA